MTRQEIEARRDQYLEAYIAGDISSQEYDGFIEALDEEEDKKSRRSTVIEAIADFCTHLCLWVLILN